MSEFANWFNSELSRNDMTATEFSERFGFAYRTVHSWVTGDRNPGSKSIDRIADALNADVTMVMTLAGHLPVIDPIEPDDQIVRICHKLERLRGEPIWMGAVEYQVDYFLNELRLKRKAERERQKEGGAT